MHGVKALRWRSGPWLPSPLPTCSPRAGCTLEVVMEIQRNRALATLME
ncbi:MAG TPA: hypothetical protein VFL54_02280 [Gammaproteobacteria bacterium]|nr:hypothetical protein [Gammaproteobacteria bacterium]